MSLRGRKSEAIFGGMGILPVIKRQAGCLSHQSREARDRLGPGSESGVTNDRQSRVPRGTAAPMR